jgi:hypothetical protein
MSIYATLWQLKFPRYGDAHTGCDWIEVKAQGVPAHIGSPDEDPEDLYAAFLPPAVPVPPNDSAQVIGHRPRLVAEVLGTAGRGRLLFEDGSATDIDLDGR